MFFKENPRTVLDLDLGFVNFAIFHKTAVILHKLQRFPSDMSQKLRNQVEVKVNNQNNLIPKLNFEQLLEFDTGG